MARQSSNLPDTSIGPILQVQDLTGGVSLRGSIAKTRPQDSRELINGYIGNEGELGIYPGWLTFSTTSLGARRLQGGKRIYLFGSTFTLGADNGSVYKPSDAGVWGSSVLTGLHATNPVDFVYDRSFVAAFDGSTVPKKSTDGSTWTQLGISAPTVPPTGAAIAGGTLTAGNTYEFVYAYYNSALLHVGNISAAVQVAAAGANLTAQIGVTASADPQVTNIRIYARDVTAGETVLRLTATVANATGNTNITAENWINNEEAPTNHNVAVAMSHGIVWKNRWWGIDATVKNRVRFTEIFQPMTWPVTFFIDLPFPRGESITLVVALGDTLILFGYTTFFVIIGQTSLDFEVRPALGAQDGALGFRAGCLLENGVVHAGASGVYLFTGATDELLSHRISPAWNDMVDRAGVASLDLLPVVYHQLHKELRIGATSLYPANIPGEWIADMNRTRVDNEVAWFATDRPVGGYIVWDGKEATVGNHGRIFSWNSNPIARLYEERVGTTADGADILMQYDGPGIPFGLQRARVVETYLEIQPANGLLTVDLSIDGSLMGGQLVNIGLTNLPLYGLSQYGIGTYASGPARVSKTVIWPLKADGYMAQFIINYLGQGSPKIYTYGHNIVPEPLPRGIA